MAIGSPQKTQTVLSEINVTPLVDVMLVLLIVFMVSAPLMQQGVQVDLPKTTAQSMSDVPDQVVLVVQKDRSITLNNHPIERGTLFSRLSAMAQAKPDMQVFIQADRGLPYGLIAAVMAEVKQAQVTRVGLVTEPGDSERL